MLALLMLALATVTEMPERRYHDIAARELARTRHTHVRVCGEVVGRRRQRDGDWHVWLRDPTATIVAEIIPSIPLPVPRRGARVCLSGISRRDRVHGWPEIHPVEAIAPLVPRDREEDHNP